MTNLPTQRVKLDFLIEQTSPLYPEPKTWDTTVAFMQEDEVEAETLSELATVLVRDGDFREPVYVGRDLDRDDGDTGYYVYNGTHRMVAHIINGTEFIDVIYESEDESDETSVDDDYVDPNEYEPGKYRVPCTMVEFVGTVDDDEYDKLFSVLRSFKISDDVWVTSDMMSSTSTDIGTRMDFCWDLVEMNDALLSRINDICIERIARFGTVIPASIKTEYDYWTDED